jgi:hypothetical protein
MCEGGIMKQERSSTIRISLDLTPHGVKSVVVSADTAEGRDEAIERLRRCLPQLELLESALQAEAPELSQ